MAEASVLVPVLSRPIDARIRPPGSKSETIRALAAAALADGRSHLYGALTAEDTMAMVTALRALAIEVGVDSEPWTVDGHGGRLSAPPRPIDVNESGLAARILVALAGSLDGATTITGRGKLPQRPMEGLLTALRSQGVGISGDRLPLEVIGRGPLWGGPIEVDCSATSQFATALMLAAPIMHTSCRLEIKGLTGSRGYLDMTASAMRRFGAVVEPTVTGYEIANGGYSVADVVIEPDASAAVYPMAVAAITGGRVVIEGLGKSSRQPDLDVAPVLESMGCRVSWGEADLTVDARGVELSAVDVEMSEAPDGSLAVAVVCLFADGLSRISGLESLRHKESDRLEAMSGEIARIGGSAHVEGDTLVIEPGHLHGASIDPHGDHRIAMALATVGTRVAGIRVVFPDVVGKTWPLFWSFLDDLDR
ncbi:MAG: 3-phosphoshikimate 1-carboxyvinyltransferase [Acidimicrobiia bacterium]